ncbi:MAG: hypothetical protein RJA61_304 [Candidatus Parcubacteria bacterium]|jgi:hypothetical protein
MVERLSNVFQIAVWIKSPAIFFMCYILIMKNKFSLPVIPIVLTVICLLFLFNKSLSNTTKFMFFILFLILLIYFAIPYVVHVLNLKRALRLGGSNLNTTEKEDIIKKLKPVFIISLVLILIPIISLILKFFSFF